MSMVPQGLTEKPERDLLIALVRRFVCRGYLIVVPSLDGHRTHFVSKGGGGLPGLGEAHLLGPNAHLWPAKTCIWLGSARFE